MSLLKRHRDVRRLAVVVVAAGLALAACDPVPGPRSDGDKPSAEGSGSEESSEEQIYAAVIRRLVMKDHTFGKAASPFKHVYVVDGAIPRAGHVLTGLRRAPEPFPSGLKQALADRLQELPPLEFIADPDRVRLGVQGGGGVKNDGVIISLGPIEPVQGDRIQVGTGLWCGGTCGQWLTYVISRQGDRWKITDTTGPYAIS